MKPLTNLEHNPFYSVTSFIQGSTVKKTLIHILLVLQQQEIVKQTASIYQTIKWSHFMKIYSFNLTKVFLYVQREGEAGCAI